MEKAPIMGSKKVKKQKPINKGSSHTKGQWKSKTAIFFIGLSLGHGLYPLSKSGLNKMKPQLNYYYEVGIEKTVTIIDGSFEYLVSAKEVLKEKLQTKKSELGQKEEEKKKSFQIPLT